MDPEFFFPNICILTPKILGESTVFDKNIHLDWFDIKTCA